MVRIITVGALAGVGRVGLAVVVSTIRHRSKAGCRSWPDDDHLYPPFTEKITPQLRDPAMGHPDGTTGTTRHDIYLA